MLPSPSFGTKPREVMPKGIVENSGESKREGSSVIVVAINRKVNQPEI